MRTNNTIFSAKTGFCVALMAATPFLTGANEGGCGGAINSRTPAPSMNGTWDLTYDDTLEVKLNIGGAVYEESLPATGGTVSITHQGRPLTFALDCAKPEVVCPSEAWPDQVSALHRNPAFPHRFWMTIPTQSCSGNLVDADPMSCGAGTSNPDCEQVCDGVVTTRDADRFGVVNEPGDAFNLLLGAGVASNGFNCALLGISAATAELESTGTAAAGDWEATRMRNGQVVTGYSGGCLWAGDPDMDAQLEALIIGASVELRTGFEGQKQ